MMRINYQRLHFGMLACVLGLVAVALYMAFAFPYSLVHFKQADTTQLKAVFLVGRHGEVSAPREAYFEALGEEPPEDWFRLGGPDQLTAVGKERLYLLGKFLRLQYYERLLAGGNPRKLVARSADSDKCLESAQALLAGLLPPKSLPGPSLSYASSSSSSSSWLWSTNSDNDPLVRLWQPKAVHTTRALDDDLLSSQTRCLQMDSLRASWKNSSRYAQLLNEFRHDLQVLRQNTGLAFEDDLEMVADLEEQLRARAAFSAFASTSSPTMPSWYTRTLASRLAHIGDVTAGARFAHAATQRLFVGRLLHTLMLNVFAKIRSDLTSGVSLLSTDYGENDYGESQAGAGGGLISAALNETLNEPKQPPSGGAATTSAQTIVPSSATGETSELMVASTKLLPPDEKVKLKLAHQREPSMFVYLTDKQHLTALMNSLGVYTSQPHYGAALVLELHYDPVNQVHFLRLFSLNSLSHDVLPEPVRVQPSACLDSAECSPQQFERNLRHLALDAQAWQQACTVGGLQEEPAPTTSATTSGAASSLASGTSSGAGLEAELVSPATSESSSSSSSSSLEFVNPTERSDASSTSGGAQSAATTTSTTTTTTTISTTPMTTGIPVAEDSSATPAGTPISLIEKLDETLVVGPTNSRPISGSGPTDTATDRPGGPTAVPGATGTTGTTTTAHPTTEIKTTTASSASSSGSATTLPTTEATTGPATTPEPLADGPTSAGPTSAGQAPPATTTSSGSLGESTSLPSETSTRLTTTQFASGATAGESDFSTTLPPATRTRS